MFSKSERCIYGNNQLGEVICQLRFPEILKIGTSLPSEFQEEIRDEFPLFMTKKEPAAPKIAGIPGNFTLENRPATVNYQFASEDGTWRVNLTSRFIALACSQYTRWEEFAMKLDKPLASFIQTYKPAFFERVGLRYVNFISRESLQMKDVPFRELIAARYLGPLEDVELEKQNNIRSTVDAEFDLHGGCRVKLHAGPGMVNRSDHADREVKFIFDQDLFIKGKIPVAYSVGALQTIHSQAYSIFRGAITDKLHNAMEPEKV